ncbi:MAG: hypothetical protein JXR26_09245 [Balneolaceae bacterium]|nr:hypothetical protein [Balneolaceae bacterium]
MKEETRGALERRVKELEEVIARKGVGSDYVQKARRVQRDINIALMLGAATTIVGIAAWALLSSGDE